LKTRAVLLAPTVGPCGLRGGSTICDGGMSAAGPVPAGNDRQIMRVYPS